MKWLKKTLGEIHCGRHSGFSPCCILWFITGWKLVLRYAKWDSDTYTWYHRLMDRRLPDTAMHDIIVFGETYGPGDDDWHITKYRRICLDSWTMIPCPLCLWRRRRAQVLTCFCPKWKPETKAAVLKEYPELCVDPNK